MRIGSIVPALVGLGALPTTAHAHGLLIGGHDVGPVLLWVYGAAFAALAGLVVLNKVRGGDPAHGEKKALKRRIAELEHGLAACMKHLKNAEDYPAECGLSDQQRQHRLDSAVTFRRMIDEEKLKLQST